MSTQSLSSYRLQSKAHKVADAIVVGREHFDVLVSSESKLYTQCFIMHYTWVDEIKEKQTARPLAHIQISNTTGKNKVVLWQPSAFGLNDSKNLKLNIIESVMDKVDIGLAV